MDGNLIKYEAPPNPSSVLVSMPSGISTIQYGQPLMTPLYHHNEWQNVYHINNMPGDPNGHPYMQGVAAYPTNIYQSGNENLEIPMMRENGRRGRGRTNKNYGRNMQNTSDMQAAYTGDPTQYPIQFSYAYYAEPSVAPQQIPAARSPIFYPQHMYPAIPPQPYHRVE